MSNFTDWQDVEYVAAQDEDESKSRVIDVEDDGDTLDWEYDPSIKDNAR